MLKSRVLKLLKSGRQFTPAQLAGLTGSVQNSIRPRILELRSEGYAIFSKTTKNGKTAYLLDSPVATPIIADAYAAQGGRYFDRT